MKQNYHLYLGRSKKVDFTLPASWNVLHCPEPQSSPLEEATIAQMALDALRRPVGISSFERVAAKGKRIAIIVDDGTRPTPVGEILGVVLRELAGLGISRRDTTIVVALGTHAPLSGTALDARLGPDVTAQYEVVQHDARKGDFVPVVVPSREKPVGINRRVVEADARIGIGSILPHPMAGFGGGPKLIMPAVADFDSIVEHHMTLTIAPRSAYGEIADNLFHRDCMAVARAVGLDFSMNCVYDLQGQIAGIIGGRLEDAFGEAVDFSFRKMGVKFSEKVHITITSTYPHTHGLQMFKGLNGADAITKDGGAILMMAPLVTPLPEEFLQVLESIRNASGGNPLFYARAKMSGGQLFAPEKSAEFNMAMYDLLKRPPIRTILVSPLISEDTAAALGMEYASSIEEGLRALERAYPAATVAIFPSGGLVIPRKN